MHPWYLINSSVRLYFTLYTVLFVQSEYSKYPSLSTTLSLGHGFDFVWMVLRRERLVFKHFILLDSPLVHICSSFRHVMLLKYSYRVCIVLTSTARSRSSYKYKCSCVAIENGMICPKKLGRFSWSIGLGIDVGSDTFTLGGNLVTFLISDTCMYYIYVRGHSVDSSGSAKNDKVIIVINIKMSIMSTWFSSNRLFKNRKQ